MPVENSAIRVKNPTNGADGPLKSGAGCLARISALLKDESRECGGYAQLAEAIRAGTAAARGQPRDGGANNNPKSLDRRKISSICKGEHVVVSFEELDAIENYLRRLRDRKRSLSSLFSSSVLDAAGERGEVTFLVGAKTERKTSTTYVSIWDLRSVAHLLREVEGRAAGVRFDIQEVAPESRPKADHGRWDSLFSHVSAPSIVAVASPRACPGAERLLATALDLKPFGLRDINETERLPFLFVFGPKERRSSFAMGEPPPVCWMPPGAHRKGPGIYLPARSAYYPTDMGGTSRIDYGIVLAQRRANGQVLLFCGGVTGPATLGAVQCLIANDFTLPHSRIGQNSPVAWGLVEVRIKAPSGKSAGENRSVEQVRFIVGPEVIGEAAQRCHPGSEHSEMASAGPKKKPVPQR